MNLNLGHLRLGGKRRSNAYKGGPQSIEDDYTDLLNSLNHDGKDLKK